MDQSQHLFSKRLKRLNRKHRAMERGYATFMRSDGLIVAKPYAARPRLPLKPLIFCVAFFLLFKAFLVAQLGAAYADRVERLQQGTMVEQAGAWAMQNDPLSDRLAVLIKPYLP